jgi:3-hydroxybutyryl-CoA dehydrogenase
MNVYTEKDYPPLPEVQRIGVIGAGQMGGGIAQVAAQAGLDVVLMDVRGEQLEAALALMGRLLDRQVQKGTIEAADRDSALTRVSTSTEMADLGSCDLVVEAATENEELKKKIFKELDQVIAPGGIIASNTSSISITRLAAATGRPDAVIGMHFMNPVPLMALVELIRGAATSDATYAATRLMAEKMGKTCVVSKDLPGFIVNRILIPMINEAVFALADGIGTAADIDTAMKLGTNQPMGPLALADLIGLDTCLSIAEVLHKGLGDDKYRPCPLLRQYVDAGWLGKKTGKGFHQY